MEAYGGGSVNNFPIGGRWEGDERDRLLDKTPIRRLAFPGLLSEIVALDGHLYGLVPGGTVDGLD